jgi:hypothetical protein
VVGCCEGGGDDGKGAEEAVFINGAGDDVPALFDVVHARVPSLVTVEDAGAFVEGVDVGEGVSCGGVVDIVGCVFFAPPCG